MNARQESEPALTIADRLHSAAIHLLRRLRSEDERTGLGGPQLSALSVIVFAGPVTVGQLADAEQVRPPTISRLVKGLERRGLVRRLVDPEDGRVRRLEATAKGERLLREGRERRVSRLAEAIEELPGSRRERLSRALDVLEELCRPAPPEE